MPTIKRARVGPFVLGPTPETNQAPMAEAEQDALKEVREKIRRDHELTLHEINTRRELEEARTRATSSTPESQAMTGMSSSSASSVTGTVPASETPTLTTAEKAARDKVCDEDIQ